MSASESFDPLAVARPAVIRPDIPADLSAPGQDLPAPTLEQARATEQAFSTKENADAAALMGLWTAGILASELVREASGHLRKAEEEEDAERKKKIDLE